MSLINNINKESKIVGRNKHILINDAGIGSNRLVMSNNYLNYFNYYHKNLIKMNKIREIKNIERKKISKNLKKIKLYLGSLFPRPIINILEMIMNFSKMIKRQMPLLKKRKLITYKIYFLIRMIK